MFEADSRALSSGNRVRPIMMFWGMSSPCDIEIRSEGTELTSSSQRFPLVVLVPHFCPEALRKIDNPIAQQIPWAYHRQQPRFLCEWTNVQARPVPKPALKVRQKTCRNATRSSGFRAFAIIWKLFEPNQEPKKLHLAWSTIF